MAVTLVAERGVLITQAADAPQRIGAIAERLWLERFGNLDGYPWGAKGAHRSLDSWAIRDAIVAYTAEREALIREDERTHIQARIEAEFAVERALARQGVPQHPKDAAYVNALLEAGGRASAAIDGRVVGEA